MFGHTSGIVRACYGHAQCIIFVSVPYVSGTPRMLAPALRQLVLLVQLLVAALVTKLAAVGSEESADGWGDRFPLAGGESGDRGEGLVVVRQRGASLVVETQKPAVDAVLEP